MNGRVGYRFHPNDEELVGYFLKHKIDGRDHLVEADIRLIELYKFEPWDLPRLAAQGSNDRVWYFFCRREQLKNKNASRSKFNRSTNTGHWKLTGRDHPVKAKAANKKIGTKRTYVFYMRCSPKEIRTNWVLQEYEPITVIPNQKDLVLYKLKEKADGKVDEGESSHHDNIISHLVDTPNQQVDSQLLLEHFFTGNGVNLNPSSSTQPQIYIDEGISLDDLVFNDVFHNDDVLDNDMGKAMFQLHTSESKEDPNEMADSFIVEPHEYNVQNYVYGPALSSDGSDHEETARTHLNHLSSPQSLTGVYIEDMDDSHSDIVYARAQSFIPNFRHEPANSNEYRQTRRVQTITETLPPTTYFQGAKADSTIDSYQEINRVGAVGKEFPVDTRTRMHQLQSRSANIKVEKEVTPKTSMVQGKMSGASEYKAREARENITRESLKENTNVKTEKEMKMANSTSLKLRDNAITGNNETGSFIRLESSQLDQRPPPPSVYVVRLVIGLFLCIAVIWELLIRHD